MAYTFRHGDRPLEGVTVQRAVGRGGFGEVYYAISDAGKQLALKYLRDNPDVELRGIAHVMNLKSPHLITIYDVRHSVEGDPFVVMEYVSGPSLRDVMSAEPNGFSPEKAAFFLNGIAQGLSYLHERGIVHRDLKPGNIFYDDGYVKIGDYGLSKHISVSQHSGNTVSVGTVHYMAPEIGSGSYSKAIDIYSLGVILYEMLTGRLPFTGKSMGEILMRHLNDHPDLRGLPQGFGPIIAKALAKDPEQRYQNVDAFVDAVANIADIEDSLSAFDPRTLTSVPRTDTSDDATRTSPAPPRPGMDIRDIPRQAGKFAAGVADHVEKDLYRVNDALQTFDEKLTGKKRKKWFDRGRNANAQYVSAPVENRWAQIVTLLLVTIGVAVAITFLTGLKDEGGIAVFWFLTLSVAGTLFAQMKLLAKNPHRHWLFDRIVLTSAAGITMLFGFAMAEHNEKAFAIGAALLCVIFIFDWSKRIEAGRRGNISGDDAILPAVVGAFAAANMDGNFVAGGAAAAVVSLLTQAAAGLWPLYKVRRDDPPEPFGSPTPKPPNYPSPASYASYEYKEVPPLPKQDPGEGPGVATGAAPAKAKTQEASVQPSFVGHRAGGMSLMIGKLLMLAGFFVIFSAAYVNIAQAQNWHHGEFQEVMNSLSRVNEIGLFGIGLGALFLAISRRRTSWLHIIRALAAGGFLFWAAVLAGMPGLGPDAAGEFARQGLSAMSKGDVGPTVVMFGIAVALGTALLKWRHRPNDQIVV